MVGSGKTLGSGRKIDEGKNRALFLPLVFLFALAAYDLTCSPLSKRLEQANLRSDLLMNHVRCVDYLFLLY